MWQKKENINSPFQTCSIVSWRTPFWNASAEPEVCNTIERQTVIVKCRHIVNHRRQKRLKQYASHIKNLLHNAKGIMNNEQNPVISELLRGLSPQ